MVTDQVSVVNQLRHWLRRPPMATAAEARMGLGGASMSVAVIMGSAGLIKSEAVRGVARHRFNTVGIDTDLRWQFSGEEATKRPNRESLLRAVAGYEYKDMDIRDAEAVFNIFQRYGLEIPLVIPPGALPPHNWVARAPFVDAPVNGNGPLVLLVATRQRAQVAAFIFTSTDKVCGDPPNTPSLVQLERRSSRLVNQGARNPSPAGLPVIDHAFHLSRMLWLNC
jgi:UDP-glucose 4-epimerase